MRVLEAEEIAQVGGGFEFGCTYLDVVDIGEIGGGVAVLGSAWGSATFGTAAGAGAGAALFGALAAAGIVGYDIGVTICRAIGNCEGGS